MLLFTKCYEGRSIDRSIGEVDRVVLALLPDPGGLYHDGNCSVFSGS